MDLIKAMYASSSEEEEEASSQGQHIEVDEEDSHRGKERFLLIREEQQNFKKFNTNCRRLVIQFNEPRPEENPFEWLKASFQALLDTFIPTVTKPGDKVGLSIYDTAHPEFDPIFFSFRRYDQLSSEVILQRIEAVVQSNKKFGVDAPMEVRLTIVDMPEGRGRNKMRLQSATAFLKKKHCVINVDNDDALCLPRTIVAAKARIQKDKGEISGTEYKNICDKRSRIQKIAALQLMDEAGVLEDEAGGFSSLLKYQRVLPNYNITVYDDREGKHVLFEGNPERRNQRDIDLLLHDEHYYVITSMSALAGVRFYCRACHHPYENAGQHKCTEKCPRCMHSPPCTNDVTEIQCQNCRRKFFGSDCLSNHLKNNYPDLKQSVCATVRKCAKCHITYNLVKRKKHTCGEKWCTTCKVYVLPSHQCFIKPLENKNKKKKKNAKVPVFICYDFECRQDEPHPDNPSLFLHVPNYAVCQTFCDSCKDQEDMEGECSICGPRQRLFSGDTVVTEVLDFIVQNREEAESVTAIAHNAKGYDAVFVLREMITNKRWKPEVIKNGSKILLISYDKVRFIDSLSFFVCPLSSLPKMFDFKGVKGYFPHFFNTEANQDYVGPLPEKDFYGYQQMKGADKKTFESWYVEQTSQNVVFNFKDEIKKYCTADVEILRKAVIRFRDLFLSITDIDPFSKISIAGTAMATFRTLFLKPDTISLIPPGGYRHGDKQSTIALKWLDWMMYKQKVPIQHAGNGREKRVGRFKVDGYCPNFDGRETVLEFLGCYFHGCPICFPIRDAKIRNSEETMEQAYESTKNRLLFLENAGYRVIVKWECAFKAEMNRDRELQEFIRARRDADELEPLEERDAFFGGRTNCCKKYYKADEKSGEKIKYYDVCSLYPFICKYGKFPVKHPKILFGEDCPQQLEEDGTEGLVKLTILPPQNLYHAVLPVRTNDKLYFPLCRTCAVNQQNDICLHSEEERALTGTWVTLEVKKAIEKGYKILKIHEVWKYEITQYDKGTGEGGLFAEYVNTFLKLKAEASDWPAECDTPETKQAFIDEYRRKENIQIEPKNMKKNSGLRTIAKLLLNSLYGKFGQRIQQTQTRFYDDEAEYFRVFEDQTKEVHDATPINEMIMMLTYSLIKDAEFPRPFTNVIIAAFVTAQARLELYKYLDQLGERVLYFDTDSVIFTEKPGEESPPIGSMLGELTDELVEYGAGAFISEFASGGPKNYGYIVKVPGKGESEQMCKVRGITLNHENSQKINFETMRDAVLGTGPSSIETCIPKKIQIYKKHDVVSRQMRKKYRPVYGKRKEAGDEDWDTVPYGYKRLKLDLT